MEEIKKRVFNPRVETRLKRDDFVRLERLALERNHSKSDLVREAVLWYLGNQDKLREDEQESELRKAIRAMTDRVCGMLARQGAEVGTLYELAWQSHVENKIQERFVRAANTVKQNMRKRLTDDERVLAKKMKDVVEG